MIRNELYNIVRRLILKILTENSNTQGQIGSVMEFGSDNVTVAGYISDTV